MARTWTRTWSLPCTASASADVERDGGGGDSDSDGASLPAGAVSPTSTATADAAPRPRVPGEQVLFMVFCQAERPKIVKANPSMDFNEVGKALGAAWGKLSDAQKAKFTATAATSGTAAAGADGADAAVAHVISALDAHFLDGEGNFLLDGAAGAAGAAGATVADIADGAEAKVQSKRTKSDKRKLGEAAWGGGPLVRVLEKERLAEVCRVAEAAARAETLEAEAEVAEAVARDAEAEAELEALEAQLAAVEAAEVRRRAEQASIRSFLGADPVATATAVATAAAAAAAAAAAVGADVPDGAAGATVAAGAGGAAKRPSRPWTVAPAAPSAPSASRPCPSTTTVAKCDKDVLALVDATIAAGATVAAAGAAKGDHKNIKVWPLSDMEVAQFVGSVTQQLRQRTHYYDAGLIDKGSLIWFDHDHFRDASHHECYVLHNNDGEFPLQEVCLSPLPRALTPA